MSLVVKFGGAYKPVLKHGDGDQSPHGRRGGGSLDGVPFGTRLIEDSGDTNSLIREPNPPQIMYHVAPKSAREDILKHGLDPKDQTNNTGAGGGSTYHDEHLWMKDDLGEEYAFEYRPTGIYMFNSLEHAQRYAGSSGNDIYKIDTKINNREIIRDPVSVGNWDYMFDDDRAYVTRYVEPAALSLMSEDMSKHESHDQSSHGNRGAGEPLSGFTKVDNGLSFTDDYVLTTPQGSVSVRFEEGDTGNEISAKDKEDFLGAVADLHAYEPIDGMQVTVDENDFDSYPESTVAWARVGGKEIHFRSSYVQVGNSGRDAHPAVSMPSEGNVGRYQWTMAHEWGHAVDKRLPNDQIDDNLIRMSASSTGKISSAGISMYGMTSHHEMFSEMYAEWFASGGKTSSTTSQDFAKKYGWNTRVVKAVNEFNNDEGLIIADTFDFNNPPKMYGFENGKPVEVGIDYGLVKTVGVKFPAGVKPLLKHGSHDQSSHGNRGSGLGNSVLSANAVPEEVLPLLKNLDALLAKNPSYNPEQMGVQSGDDAAIKAEMDSAAMEIGKYYKENGMSGEPLSGIDSWNCGAEIVGRRMREHAAKQNIIDPSDVEMADSLLKSLADEDVTVRVGDAALGKILSEGGFKTQFETKTTGGFYDPERRKDAEFGSSLVSRNADVSARPIYGLMGTEQSSVVSQYGHNVVVLKSGVRERTTVTVGDSLMTRSNAMPLGNPTRLGMAAATPLFSSQSMSRDSVPVWKTIKDRAAAKNVVVGQGFTPEVRDAIIKNNFLSSVKESVGYIEAQVHGGVKASDIARIMVPKDLMDGSVAQQARSLGIEVVAQKLTSGEIEFPALVKEISIKFPAGVKPLLKHGSHDQSSHGRRGVNSTVDSYAGNNHSVDDVYALNVGRSDPMIEKVYKAEDVFDVEVESTLPRPVVPTRAVYPDYDSYNKAYKEYVAAHLAWSKEKNTNIKSDLGARHLDGSKKGVENYVSEITKSDWFVERFGEGKGLPKLTITAVTVDSYSGRHSVGKRNGKPVNNIAISKPYLSTEPTILHEVAHYATTIGEMKGFSAHGPEFVRDHLFLVSKVMGSDAEKTLRDSYITEGVL